jgi:aldehyde:ferredoxin oxidoreductase
MRILRINTRTQEYAFEELGEYAGLGGRALTSRVVNKEVPADCHPLSAENKLVFASGVLACTNAANSGRVSVGAKSPLTGGIKESNSGGQFANQMGRMDLQAIILEDKPEDDSEFTNIFISKDEVKFTSAKEIVGMHNYPAQEKLQEEFGQKAVTCLCGPAGEHCMQAATIQFSDPEGLPTRSAGRGGMGAVLGSKKVKSLILDHEVKGKVLMGDEEGFKAARKEWTDILRSHPVTSQGLPAYGTAILVNIVNEAGALPTKNFRTGRFENAEKISGETLADTITKRDGKVSHGCHTGCIIQCSQVYNDKDGKMLTTGFEYETIWGFGAHLLIDDLDLIATMDRTCDEIGMDTIEMASSLAMAMEGGLIAWGDGPAALEYLRKVGTGDPVGRILGNGAGFTAAAFGVDRIPTVKNQSMPAYDPRAVKGVGVTYATTPMGADHTAGYAVCQNVLKCGGDVDGHNKEGNIETSKNLQIATAAVDSLGLCLFVAFAVLDDERGVPCMAKLVAGLLGSEYSVDDVVNLGIGALQDELDFNRRAGFTDKDDQLPRWFTEEALPPHNVKWDFSTEELQGAKV